MIELDKNGGTLGIIFRKAQNRIQDPTKLKRLIALIDEETWKGVDIDILGEICEGLLPKKTKTPRVAPGNRTLPSFYLR